MHFKCDISIWICSSCWLDIKSLIHFRTLEWKTNIFMRRRRLLGPMFAFIVFWVWLWVCSLSMSVPLAEKSVVCWIKFKLKLQCRLEKCSRQLSCKNILFVTLPGSYYTRDNLDSFVKFQMQTTWFGNCAMVTQIVTHLCAKMHIYPAKAHGSGPRVGSIKSNVMTKLQPPHVKRPRLGTMWDAICIIY